MAAAPRYSILQEVGRGNYGVVYEALDNESGQRVAVKRMHCNDPENAELALREFRALQSIRRRHDNVIQLEECVLQDGPAFHPMGSGHSSGNLLLVETCLKGRRRLPDPRSSCSLWFVMEFCEGGNMSEFLLGRDPDPLLNGSFLRQLSAAVAFLHRHGIVHRDLKSDNILVTLRHGHPELKGSDGMGMGPVNHSQPPKTWNFPGANSRFPSLGEAVWIHQAGLTPSSGVFLPSGISNKGIFLPPPFLSGSSFPHLLYPGIYISRGKKLIPLGEALLEDPTMKLQIPRKGKGSIPEDLCQLLHGMLAFNPKERLDAFQLESRIQQISYGKKRRRS
ncbi:STK35 kinase, partial [Pitta sordida]|nr:STK35 kinase [Pitta sordida]